MALLARGARRGGLLVAALAAQVAAAEAQTTPPPRPVTVSLSFNMTIPAFESGPQGNFTLSEGTRKAFYELVAGECRLLLATIASSCQVINVNVNISEQRHHQPNAYVQVHGSGSYAVTLKAN